jgi:hypothetical protein
MFVEQKMRLQKKLMIEFDNYEKFTVFHKIKTQQKEVSLFGL